MSHEDLVTVVTGIYLLASFAEILNTWLLGRLVMGIAGARHPLVVPHQNMLLELRLLREGCLALTAPQRVPAMSQDMFLQVVALEEPPATHIALVGFDSKVELHVSVEQ